MCTRGVCLDIGVKVLLGSDFLALEEVVGHDVTLVEDIRVAFAALEVGPLAQHVSVSCDVAGLVTNSILFC